MSLCTWRSAGSQLKERYVPFLAKAAEHRESVMGNRRLRVAVLAILGIGSSAMARQHPGIGGCYAFQPYTWSDSVASEAVPTETPPDTFRLYRTRGRPREEGKVSYEAKQLLVRPRMKRSELGGALAVPGAFWYEPGPDSLEIVWMNGFTGFRVAARRVGERWVGRLEAVSDEIGPAPNPHAKVAFTSVRCPLSLQDSVPAEDPRGGKHRAHRDQIQSRNGT